MASANLSTMSFLKYTRQIFRVGMVTIGGAAGQKNDATLVSAVASHTKIVGKSVEAHVTVEKQ